VLRLSEYEIIKRITASELLGVPLRHPFKRQPELGGISPRRRTRTRFLNDCRSDSHSHSVMNAFVGKM
jgi:hypothetical protein